nr:MAG TPA: hypothetical protein [Caudoviricetes sp.]
MSDEIKMTPETGMTDEEIAELEKQREAAREARLAPFKALRKRMDAGLRYAVANDGVTGEELLTMSAATPEWKPGMTLAVGDTVMHGGSMFVVIQSHTTQADWIPGTATQSLYRRVQPEGSTEWQPDTDYATGAECTYEGSAYTCLQGHTSQAGWEPPNVPSLWKLKTE